MKNAKLKFAISTIISVIAAFAIFLVVLMIAQTNHHTFDLTTDQRFTISDQSRIIAKEMPQNVEAFVFLMGLDSDGRQKATELLDQYKNASEGKLKYTIIDPKRSPVLAKKYDVRMPGCVVFATPKGRTSRATTIDEGQVTNALQNLADVTEKKVYFLTGHGEVSAYSSNSEQNVKGLLNMSQFRSDLASEGFVGENLNLAQTKQVPVDASIIVIPGPTTELLPAEQKLIEDWVDNGGRVLLMLELETANKYDNFLNKYGFKSADEMVIDEMAQVAGTEAVYSIALQYNQESPIVKDFNMTTLFKLARTVEPAEKLPAGAKVTPLASTGPNAFTIMLSKVLEKKQIELNDKDILRQGSMSLAAVGTYPVKDSAKDVSKDKDDKKVNEGRIVVIGDSEFCCNELYKSVGNRDFVLNVLNWLGASENHITIRAKDSNSQPLILADNTAMRIKVFLVIALPLCVLILGIANSRRRRA